MLQLLFACAAPEAAVPSEPPPEASPPARAPLPPPTWPAPGAALRVLPPPQAAPQPQARTRLVVDAGHGAPGNPGNTSARCESEAEFTRRTQDALLARLAGAPELEVRAGRPGSELVTYDARITAFHEWPADAVLSLHSDARQGSGAQRDARSGCWAADDAEGFAVLYSDEGDAALAADRAALARAVATAMHDAGFLPYGGEDYAGLYGPDTTAGVFVDRHGPGKRIKMLRATRVPTVIVETHQALDRDEAERWDEPATLDAFAAAVRAAAASWRRTRPAPR